MRIAITGGRGQLGRELQGALKRTHQTTALARPDFDITETSIVQKIADLAPDLVIHTAAMTDVDACARDPDAAFRVNALGTQNVALACQSARAPMLYVSTNEVFDGTQESPYLESDEPRPINPYGVSKLAGERYVQMLLDRFYIVRTAWLYALGGNKFPDKIIAAAEEARGRRSPKRSGGDRAPLRVVDDEFGNPTYAPDLARAIARLIETNHRGDLGHFGVYHLVNEGVASRYAWAKRVLELKGLDIPITPIKLADYTRDSTPPPYSALANFRAATMLDIKLRKWEDALEDFFKPQ